MINPVDFSFLLNVVLIEMSTTIQWIAMKFPTNCHGPQRMNRPISVISRIGSCTTVLTYQLKNCHIYKMYS